MSKEIIKVNGAVAAVGPYNQVTQACGLYFFAGQIPIDPKTGEMVAGGIVEQTRQVLSNIAVLLQGIGKTKKDVVRCLVFLTDLALFGEMNKIYAEFFGSDFPARSTIQVAALPKGALVEIEATVAE